MNKITPLLMTALSMPVLAQQTDYELMQQWLDIESQKGKLTLSWQTNQQTLENQLALLKEEKAALEALLKKAKQANNEVDEKRLALTQQQVALEKNQTIVSDELDSSLQFVKRITPLLPPPLQQEWQKKMPALEQQSTSSSDKLERILSMYKTADEFNQQVASHNTSMVIPTAEGEKQQLVSQMYLGLSYAWYISQDAQQFGIGRVEQSGWVWYHNDQVKQVVNNLNSEELAYQLGKMKAILAKPTSADFIQAPLAISSINKELL